MPFLIFGWTVMAAAMYLLAQLPPERPVWLYWAAIAACACAIGAAAIASQPLGRATMPGRLGASVVRWGFRAGNGRLLAAAVISWGVWLLLGFGAIAAVRARGDLTYRLLLLAWVVDLALLLYVAGLVLTRARSRGGSTVTVLLPIIAALAGMIAVSGYLWFGRGSAEAQRSALLLAGGPPLVIGAGYGLYLLVVLTVGRGARWN